MTSDHRRVVGDGYVAWFNSVRLDPLMTGFDPNRTKCDEQHRFESCGRRVADDRRNRFLRQPAFLIRKLPATPTTAIPTATPVAATATPVAATAIPTAATATPTTTTATPTAAAPLDAPPTATAPTAAATARRRRRRNTAAAAAAPTPTGAAGPIKRTWHIRGNSRSGREAQIRGVRRYRLNNRRDGDNAAQQKITLHWLPLLRNPMKAHHPL